MARLFVYGLDHLSAGANIAIFAGSILGGVLLALILFKIIFYIVKKKNKL